MTPLTPAATPDAPVDLAALRSAVDAWFTPAALERVMGAAASASERIARDWLGRDGKRWRPLLTVGAWLALADGEAAPGDDVVKAAVAVECFHKASLVHDDIEDGDDTRYGGPTVHAEHGVAVALNVGDLLLGEGYRLIGELDASAQRRAAMLRIAAAGHRDLCIGQGRELVWTRDPGPLSSAAVLEIFRLKTAPAFEVALRLGATLGGADDEAHAALHRFSEALGIAYQIRDDADDWFSPAANDAHHAPSDFESARPTIIPALGLELAPPDDRPTVERYWRRAATADDYPTLRRIFTAAGVEARAAVLYREYVNAARTVVREVRHDGLRAVLAMLIQRIFDA